MKHINLYIVIFILSIIFFYGNKKSKIINIHHINSQNKTIENTLLNNTISDTLSSLFKTLKIHNYRIDTSFILSTKDILPVIINIIDEEKDTIKNIKKAINTCECVDSIKLFKINKINFNHKNKDEYFSFPAKKFDTELWLEIWYFDNNNKATNCYKDNITFFVTNSEYCPYKSFTFTNLILKVSPACLKETELYKELINIIDSTITPR